MSPESKSTSFAGELNISADKFYNWRSKFSGLEVNGAQRLTDLESESNKLKRGLPDKLPEVEAVKDALSKKWHLPARTARHSKKQDALSGHLANMHETTAYERFRETQMPLPLFIVEEI